MRPQIQMTRYMCISLQVIRLIQREKNMKRIAKKRGFTLVELIVSMAIVSIFVLSLTAVLSVGSKLYLQETTRGNTQVAVEVLSDDLKGYVMYGNDIRVIYVLQGNESAVAGVDVSKMEKGTEIHLEKQEGSSDVYGVFRAPNGDESKMILSHPEMFEGNGIDLELKKFYLTKTDAGVTYITGLPYDISYYRGLNLDLRIKDLSFTDEEKKGIYEIEISGEAARGRLKVKSGVAVSGLNEKE